MKGIVVYGFAGTGKTTFCKNFVNAIDLEESDYRYLDYTGDEEKRKGEQYNINPEFPNNYFTAMNEALEKYDYVFVGYNAIKYCQDNRVDYFLIFPKLSSKQEYLKRYKLRKNSQKFIDSLDKNYEIYLKKEMDDKYAEKIIMLDGKEYVLDAFKKLNLITPDNKCIKYVNEKVSIIIPIYNAEKYLMSLFKSIEFQSYKNFEVILIDDGSTDDSKTICLKYCLKHSYAKYYTKANGGASSARNFGLKYTTGKYVCFVDSDDVLEKNYIKKLANSLIKTNSDFAMCGIQEVISEKINCYGPQKTDNGNNNNADFFVSLFNNCWFPVPWNKMFRRNIIINNKIKYLEKIRYDEDTVFNFMYYALARNIVIIPDNLYKYYIRKNTLTKKGETKIFDNSLKTIKYRLSYPKKLFGENKKAVYISAKKILKAVLQEAKIKYQSGCSENKIEEIYKERLVNKYVIDATKYICVLENNYKEYMLYNKIFIEKKAKGLMDYCKS